jgi:ABC-type uncharacterized transport system permease subunit
VRPRRAIDQIDKAHAIFAFSAFVAWQNVPIASIEVLSHAPGMAETFMLDDIAHTIQLAMAPAFLLTAIGAILSLITGRLGRTVDRARWIEQNFAPKGDHRHDDQVHQLRLIDDRMHYANRALILCTISAMLICIVIAGMFSAAMFNLALGQLVAGTFIIAMLLLIAGLGLFLMEVRIAVRATQIQDELLERE